MKSFWRLLILVALVFAIVGCKGSEGNPTIDSSVTREVADTFGNMANGVTQETNDSMLFFSTLGDSHLSGSSVHANSSATYTVVLGGGISGWSYSGGVYSRKLTDITFNGPNVSGSINPYYVTVKLGSGVPITSFNTVNNVTYHRAITGTLDNTLLDIHRSGTVTTDLVFSGLNDTTPGVIMNGTRTATWTVTGAWSSSGTITFTFTDVTAKYDPLIGGGYIAVYQGGTIAVSYNGTITGPGGTRTINRSGTISVTGQRTVAVTIDGNTVTVDVTNGAISG